MKKRMLIVCLLFIVAMGNVTPSFAWGMWGHNQINRGAVLALPPEMGTFFYNHVDFITQESTVPDLRKYTYHDRSENCKHYINLEKYNYGKSTLPANLKDAIAKFGQDSVNRYGILPWHIQDMMEKLTEAFRNKRTTEILLIAADLGHYVGDAHVPLHTTLNHDGQLTGQSGIHAFWEAQIPELFGADYKLYSGNALYIKNVNKAAWEIVESSYSKIDKLLTAESGMHRDNPIDKQYVIGPDGAPVKNKFNQPVHTYQYAHIYHELLDGMVEQQLRLSIQYTADLWYTAWVNAGKPDLTSLDYQSLTERNKADYKYYKNEWVKNGKGKAANQKKNFQYLPSKNDKTLHKGQNANIIYHS